jgi:hypothetical protein
VTWLTIQGTGVHSLRGIERFTSLEGLNLEGVGSIDLRSLERVHWLTWLAVERPKPDVDLSGLARLTFLEDVHLESSDDATDKAIAELDLSRLSRLRGLGLSASSPGIRMPVDLDWVADARLRNLYLYGFRPRGRSLEDFFTLVAGVESVFILTTNRDEIARLAKAPPPPNVTVDTLYVSDSGPEIREVNGQQYIAADLATNRGYETNYDAAERLEAFLKRTAPDVASQLVWDTEADHVVVLSDDDAALKHVITVLRADKW